MRTWQCCNGCGRGAWRYDTDDGRTEQRCWCGARRPRIPEPEPADDKQLPLFDLEEAT
jgi:hypothetical protein